MSDRELVWNMQLPEPNFLHEPSQVQVPGPPHIVSWSLEIRSSARPLTVTIAFSVTAKLSSGSDLRVSCPPPVSTFLESTVRVSDRCLMLL